VLVVDDEEAVRALARRALERFGYTVLQAADGVEALLLFQRRRAAIRLVVTDIVMPQMDGRTLAGRLREMQPGIRLLFVSGCSGQLTAEQAASRPRTTFLGKPFTGDELGEKVRKALAEPGR
jgi:two-component system cell cycle sensor histidine kinase/response regulator CckA